MGRAAVFVLVFISACGGRVIRFEAPAKKAAALSHTQLDVLLARYVDDRGQVDYQRWHDSEADVAALDRYLGRLTSASPKNRPDLFAHRAQELTYWVNLYNALVLREVLRHWPLDSVGDIEPTLGSKLFPRRGFFRDTYFVIGGAKMNLDDIEHQVLRKTFGDARLHFAINCGSASCPILRGAAYTDGDIDAQLDRATRQFVNDPGNVRVDTAAETIRLSKLFDWYEDDFVADAKRRTGDKRARVLDFVLLYADEPLARSLRRARASRYDVDHFDYDWSINRGETEPRIGSDADPRIGKAVTGESFELLGGGSFRPADHRGKIIVIDFWATYCKPCKKGLVELARAAAEHPDKLVVVAVSQDEDPAQLPAYLEALDAAPTTIAVDPTQSAAAGVFAVSRLPTQIVLDERGVIRAVREGATADSLADELARLGLP